MRLRSERGQALIEMTFAFPLLLLVMVSIFEFGRAFQTYEVLTNAAREGARVAVLPSQPAGAAEGRARDYLAKGGLNSTTTDGVTVAVTPTTVSLGGTATTGGSQVTITYPFTFMVLQPVARLVISGSTVGAPITMTGQAAMRNEF